MLDITAMQKLTNCNENAYAFASTTADADFSNAPPSPDARILDHKIGLGQK